LANADLLAKVPHGFVREIPLLAQFMLKTLGFADPLVRAGDKVGAKSGRSMDHAPLVA
jgi:hypothetical protein